ncbi:MAG: hypothetical protein ACKOA8_02870 [Deltaproteobacteria bacterium]
MIKSRLSLTHETLESTSKLEAIGTEEKEIFMAALGRLETQKTLSASLSQIGEALNQQTLPVWIAPNSFFSTLSQNASKLTLAESFGLVIPEDFFNADPVTQETYLIKLSEEIAKSDASILAKISNTPSEKSH